MSRSNSWMLPRVVSGAVILAGISCAASAGAQPTGDVLLWNTLDSVYEIEHSRIGPNGAVVGSSYAFEPGAFGNGYVRKSTGGNYVRFPNSILEQVRRRGTAALWVNTKVQYPEPYNYGIFGLINGAYISNGSINFEWGDTVSNGNDLDGWLVFGSGPIAMAASWQRPRYAATPGTPFHAALVWDLDGIDGTTDTVRVYRDGMLITRSDQKWNAGGALRPDFILGASPDGNGYDKYVVDNLVLYNYAKTDFSDRFQEDPSGEPAQFDIYSLRYTLGRTAAPASAATVPSAAGRGGSRIWMNAQLTLSPGSDDINPPTEDVSLAVGSWTLNIPAGSFVTRGQCFDFQGRIEGQTVFFKFRETATNSYRILMTVNGTGVNTLVDPTPVRLRVGGDSAAASVDLRGHINGVSMGIQSAGQ